MSNNIRRTKRLTDFLALNRTVAVVLATVLFFGLGEQLWEAFTPAYLEARTTEYTQQAAVRDGQLSWQVLAIIGLYACGLNLFEGICYIAGGDITARLGDRGSLILFALLTLTGYSLFLVSSSPLLAIVAVILIRGWEPLSVPVTFTTVGSSVDRSRQGMAFAIQSIQKRLPKVIGPFIAGSVIGWSQSRLGNPELGRITGMRLLVCGALALGVISLFIQFQWMPHREPVVTLERMSARQVFRSFHPTLRRLLVAEMFTRWCDWLVREFVVVYVLLTLGETDAFYGKVLVPMQHLIALATYLPIGAMTRKVGLEPFVGLTFLFFALFPLVLAWSPGGWWLVIPFMFYGLREIGEPARKALITSLMPDTVRARGVGLYWGLRSFAISSASLVGAAVWYAFGPRVLLHAAFALGCIGAALFYAVCRGNPVPANCPS
jgi:predicted MFS family arabinose efflux permease